MSLVNVDISYLNRYLQQLVQEIDEIENEIQSLKFSNGNLSWDGAARMIYNSVQDLIFFDINKNLGELKLAIEAGKAHLKVVQELQEQDLTK